MNKDLTAANASMFAPENYDHWCKIAKMMATSQMVPKGYMNRPQDILIAMELGASLGMTPLAAIQNIAVINGRPSLYGDALLAIVQGNKNYEYIKETIEKNNAGEKSAICIIKRKGHEEHQCSFSVSDAKQAGLWGKSGPWSNYPDRMLAMRARGFAIRNTFADSLFGVSIAEEVQDYEEKDITPEKNKEVISDIISSKQKPNLEFLTLNSATETPKQFEVNDLIQNKAKPVTGQADALADKLK